MFVIPTVTVTSNPLGRGRGLLGWWVKKSADGTHPCLGSENKIKSLKKRKKAGLFGEKVAQNHHFSLPFGSPPPKKE